MLHRLPWNDYFAFDGRVSTWFLCVCGRGGGWVMCLMVLCFFWQFTNLYPSEQCQKLKSSFHVCTWGCHFSA